MLRIKLMFVVFYSKLHSLLFYKLFCSLDLSLVYGYKLTIITWILWKIGYMVIPLDAPQPNLLGTSCDVILL